MKTFFKHLLPPNVITRYRHFRSLLLRPWYKYRKIDKVFTDIYRKNLWGGNPGEFCSGEGSTQYFANVYADMVNGFIQQKGITHVVDLGCGDFVVGSKIQEPGRQYIGVDIVKELIAANQKRFSNSDVSFQCLNILTDPLPDGELCLIRQVFQHLSNEEICQALQNIRKYQYVIVTEYYPAEAVKIIPNRDKPHGPDTRITNNSAVYLDLPPFSQKINTMILEVKSDHPIKMDGEMIRSFLLEY